MQVPAYVEEGGRDKRYRRVHTPQKKQQPDSSIMFSATYAGHSRMVHRSPCSSQTTLANALKSVKAHNCHQSSVLGRPRWDSQPRRPSCALSPWRPSGSSRIAADRSAAGLGHLKGPATQKRCRRRELAGASCSRGSCSPSCHQRALPSLQGLRKQPWEEQIRLDAVRATLPCGALSSPLPSHTYRAFHGFIN